MLKSEIGIHIKITVFVLALLLLLAGVSSYGANGDGGVLIIDPGSISGDSQKEGNILAEYDYAFFTEESMAEERDAKEREEETRTQMVASLFQNEYSGIDNYDNYVTGIIKSGNLFSKVNTGVETIGEEDSAAGSHISKWIEIILTGILTVLISSLGVSYIRKRNEHKYNNKTA